MPASDRTRAHGLAWLYLSLHVAAHVLEEALGGFLDVWNPMGVTFPVWIGTLVTALAVMIGVTPLVTRGAAWAVTASYALGAAMIANGVNHLLSPLYLGRFLPGQYTSPLLIAASIWLIVKARAVSREATRGDDDSARDPAGPLIGTIVFFLVAPGTVVGWIPFALSGWVAQPPLGGVEAGRALGGLLIALGLAGLVDCFLRFALIGRGTPAPVAPTDRLVVSGLYRYTRNPMYVAVVASLLGQALLFGSVALLQYAALVWTLAHLFVLIYEEPALRSRYGESYERYRANVPRWIPRLRAWEPPSGRGHRER